MIGPCLLLQASKAVSKAREEIFKRGANRSFVQFTEKSEFKKRTPYIHARNTDMQHTPTIDNHPQRSPFRQRKSTLVRQSVPDTLFGEPTAFWWKRSRACERCEFCARGKRRRRKTERTGTPTGPSRWNGETRNKHKVAALERI